MRRQATLREKRARDGKLTFSETVSGDNTASQALSVDTLHSYFTTDGSGTQNDFSLADGVDGQRKQLHLKTKGSTENAVVTPSNLHNGTTLTFDAEKETAELEFMDGAWALVGGNATLG